ncbi:hypothetical protein [uncultured Jatrophihabitans sp.]|uniref:LpxL/LpxP family acyltransferase n=1 Tax=uncultured Jatrophihabitans sp. TaxID=1610747 RepID=UPI0035C9B6C5
MTETEQNAARMPAKLRLRIFAKPAVHRLAPRQAGSSYARWRAKRWWTADPRAQTDARDQMEVLLRHTGSQYDFDQLGRQYMYETLRRDEMAFRPWLTTAMPVQRLDVLRAAHAGGRGVILNFMHHGQYGGVFPSINRHGISLHIVGDKWYRTPSSMSWGDLRARQHIATVCSNGVRALVAESGVYTTMCDMLRAGDVIAIASDLPGSTPTTFLGRPVKAASGAARLAKETGAALVPVTAHRGGKVQTIRIEDPLPVDSSMDVSAVLSAILRVHERPILNWPEAVERPAKRFNFVAPDDIEKYGYPPGGYFQRYRV